MTDTYLTFLETISDPWALALISYLFAGLIVLCGALVLDPPNLHSEEADNEEADTDDFFDKITEFRNEIRP